MQNERLEVALHLVKECGALLRSQTHHGVSYKEGIHDLVSDMDQKVESYLIDQLSMRFPSDYFLCEESIKQSGKYTWIIDPIDGTTNYINTHEDFAISIAFYENLNPVFGIVYDVMKEELYQAISKEGAWLNQRAIPLVKDVCVSQSVIDMSMHTMVKLQQKYHKDPLALQPMIRGHRSLGCASLAICHIAIGKLDAYVSANVKCWDYGAAWILLQEVQGHAWFEKDFFTSEGSVAIFTNSQTTLTTIQNLCIA